MYFLYQQLMYQWVVMFYKLNMTYLSYDISYITLMKFNFNSIILEHNIPRNSFLAFYLWNWIKWMTVLLFLSNT